MIWLTGSDPAEATRPGTLDCIAVSGDLQFSRCEERDQVPLERPTKRFRVFADPVQLRLINLPSGGRELCVLSVPFLSRRRGAFADRPAWSRSQKNVLLEWDQKSIP